MIGRHETVDMLIEVDHADLLSSIKEVRGGPSETIACIAPLGWMCIGGITANQKHYAHFAFFAKDADQLSSLLNRCWDIDDSKDHFPTSLDPASEAVQESLSFDKGRYTMGLPWKADRRELPDNRDMAMKRLEGTEKWLKRSLQVAEAYQRTIERYKEMEYVMQVPNPSEKRDGESCGDSGYLPHFTVVRPDKATTKTRIIFDASAQHHKVSLNDIIHQGPKLKNDLSSVILRFRREPIALMCDVQEMYLQIGLKEEDRRCHRFLWHNMQENKELDTYQFNHLIFGVNCSPFLAQFVSKYHARLHQSECPLGAETVLYSTYMDDSMDVLYWTRSKSRDYKPFVVNRISTIQRKTAPEQWRHVPLTQNPADVLSRGTTIQRLIGELKWWNGPPFLRKRQTDWPENKITANTFDVE